MSNKGIGETGIVKILSFLLAFLTMCLAVVFLLIVPSIKDYKNSKILFNERSQNLNKIEQIYNMHYNDLTALKKQNAKELRAISNAFDEAKFISGASKFFKDVKLIKLSSLEEGEDFLRYEIMVRGDVRAPKVFYDFLDYINEYGENVIRVDFPITMSAYEKHKIDMHFKIKVYEALRVKSGSR